MQARQHESQKSPVAKVPWQAQAGESYFREKTSFLYITDITLGTRVKLNRGNIHAEYTHILNNQGIHTYVVKVGNQPFHLRKFIIIDNGVDCRVDLGVILMGKIHHSPQTVYRVGGSAARAMTRRTHIHGISATKYSLNSSLGIFGRGKKLKWVDLFAMIHFA